MLLHGVARGVRYVGTHSDTISDSGGLREAPTPLQIHFVMLHSSKIMGRASLCVVKSHHQVSKHISTTRNEWDGGELVRVEAEPSRVSFYHPTSTEIYGWIGLYIACHCGHPALATTTAWTCAPDQTGRMLPAAYCPPHHWSHAVAKPLLCYTFDRPMEDCTASKLETNSKKPLMSNMWPTSLNAACSGLVTNAITDDGHLLFAARCFLTTQSWRSPTNTHFELGSDAAARIIAVSVGRLVHASGLSHTNRLVRIAALYFSAQLRKEPWGVVSQQGGSSQAPTNEAQCLQDLKSSTSLHVVMMIVACTHEKPAATAHAA